jgi:competence ComEA-like helix-hairpin-helix protein
LLDRLKEYFAFTKNEQKVFLFLSIVFLSGVAITIYKTYVIPPALPQFDYSRTDSVFLERSAMVHADTGAAPMIRKVDLNKATKTELMTLPGIGEATAERILLYREEKGRFKKQADLKNVKGIGEKKFEQLKSYIEVQ